MYSPTFETVTQARQSLVRYFDLYNREHPLSSLDAKTPDEAHFKSLSQRQAA
ncbi:integrase core domain-containing protein [Herbaspirillum sp. ST 5-3]|uniref:integrase core domain-containing protein n=1 Tax=Noviherbaspirillum sp. ST 5-3 TaxID=3349878 RepID=UPI0010A55AE4